MNLTLIAFTLLCSILPLPTADGLEPVANPQTIEEALDIAPAVTSVCVATSDPGLVANPPSYIDIKTLLITNTSGNCVDDEPCSFKVEILIKATSVFGSNFVVGLFYNGVLITMTPGGMAGTWTIPIECGGDFEFEIKTFEAATGMSDVAKVKLKCENCEAQGGVVDPAGGLSALGMLSSTDLASVFGQYWEPSIGGL